MRTPKLEVYLAHRWISTGGKRTGHEWRWRLRAANGRVIAQSSEGYRRIRDLTRSIEVTWPGTTLWQDDDGAWYLEHTGLDVLMLFTSVTQWPIIVPEGVSLHSRRRP